MIFHLFKNAFWGEHVSVLFSGSMRSLYKIYGKLRTHLKINSRLLVRREAETLNRWKREKEQCTAWGHYQFTEKLQDTQSMSCVIDVKGLSAFSVHWLHLSSETARVSHGSKLHFLLLSLSANVLMHHCPVFAHRLIFLLRL